MIDNAKRSGPQSQVIKICREPGCCKRNAARRVTFATDGRLYSFVRARALTRAAVSTSKHLQRSPWPRTGVESRAEAGVRQALEARRDVFQKAWKGYLSIGVHLSFIC